MNLSMLNLLPFIEWVAASRLREIVGFDGTLRPSHGDAGTSASSA